ncbi:hypothetical protein CRE_31455 [Caenorhabditis remanei]|uniref:F-box domain-containing protein n=1 Tax=Caenorhabditis remanei TaxID=31234 RepID=E3NAC7_CAERE|nr:hypothetical protein CRE_31455 [Caenorhabditis remanei]
MSDGDPPLRLLSLPIKPLQNIVRFMNHIDQFALSLVSKRSKELVKSIDIKCLSVNIKVDSGILIQILIASEILLECSFDDYQRSIDNPSPNNIKSKVSLENRKGFVHSKPEYRFEEWLNHALEVYHQSELNHILCITLLPDIQSFRKTFRSCSTLIILVASDEVQIQEYSRTFRPEKRLIFGVKEFLGRDRSKISDHIYEILVQNLDEIYYNFMPELILDDLLIMNSSIVRIYFYEAIKYESMLRRFIKHWMAGSNPTLRYIELESLKGYYPQAEIVLKGIKHEMVSKEDPETLNVFRAARIKNVAFLGGYNIRGKDGTVATLSFKKRRCFVMLVWS